MNYIKIIAETEYKYLDSYLNGYTKRRCTKYKVLLTSSDISA